MITVMCTVIMMLIMRFKIQGAQLMLFANNARNIIINVIFATIFPWQV